MTANCAFSRRSRLDSQPHVAVPQTITPPTMPGMSDLSTTYPNRPTPSSFGGPAASNQPRWDFWGRFMQPLIGNKPMAYVAGNHEIESVRLEPHSGFTRTCRQRCHNQQHTGTCRTLLSGFIGRAVQLWSSAMYTPCLPLPAAHFAPVSHSACYCVDLAAWISEDHCIRTLGVWYDMNHRSPSRTLRAGR